MSRSHRLSLRDSIPRLFGMFVLIVLGIGRSAQGGITVPILSPGKYQMGQQIGVVDIDIGVDKAGNQAPVGGFTVTATDSAGNTLTLQQLESDLGQDHFNWFQKVTSDNVPPKDAGGNPVTPPYIDPPNGGYSDQWADNRPWFWDEYAPPKGTPNFNPMFQLSNKISADDKTLDFSDGTGGPNGNLISFSTFLVSDFGDTTYDVLGGFSWSISIANGLTTVTSLDANAAFTGDYAKEISTQFGYEIHATAVPEPSTIVMGTISIVLVAFVRARRGSVSNLVS
jgi:hypothetical protein